MKSKKEIIKIYQDILEDIGRDITRDQFVWYAKSYGVSKKMVRQVFGSFTALKRAAGQMARSEPETMLESSADVEGIRLWINAYKAANERSKALDGDLANIVLSQMEIMKIIDKCIKDIGRLSENLKNEKYI